MESAFVDLLGVIEALPATEAAEPGAFSVADVHAWLASAQGGEGCAEAVHLCLFATSYAGSDKGAELGVDVQAMVSEAGKGGLPVNRLCVPFGLGLRVLEMAPELPHRVDPGNPPWDARQMVAATAFGMEAAAAGGDILGLGSLAGGGKVAASALLARLLEMDAPEDADAAALYQGAAPSAPLALALQLAGRDTAGILGGMIAARSAQMGVLMEGWPALAAFGILKTIAPGAVGHVRLAGFTDPEQGAYAQALGLVPLVNCVTGTAGAQLAMAAGVVRGVAGLEG